MEVETKWQVIAAAVVAVASGASVYARIDFNGYGYAFHPVATLAGSFVPVAIGTIAAYYFSPIVIHRIKVRIAASKRDATLAIGESEQVGARENNAQHDKVGAADVHSPPPGRFDWQPPAILLCIFAAMAVGGFRDSLVNSYRDAIGYPEAVGGVRDPFVNAYRDAIGYPEGRADARPEPTSQAKNPFDEAMRKAMGSQIEVEDARATCLKNGAGRYSSSLNRLGRDPAGAAEDLGQTIIAQRRALEEYCFSFASCEFNRANALEFTSAFSYCIRSAEKDMQLE